MHSFPCMGRKYHSRFRGFGKADQTRLGISRGQEPKGMMASEDGRPCKPKANVGKPKRKAKAKCKGKRQRQMQRQRQKNANKANERALTFPCRVGSVICVRMVRISLVFACTIRSCSSNARAYDGMAKGHM